MTVRIASYEGSGARWDSFVTQQPGWSHCHLAGWRTVMQRVFGHECVYLAAVTPDGTIAGVLPLVRVKSVVFGHYLVSVPFLNYGGPLGSDEAVMRLVEHAAALARADGVKLLELRSRVPLPIELPVSHRKVTVLLDVPEGGAPALWERLSTKMRTKIRRSWKGGMEMRFGTDQVQPFFEVFSRHMRDLGTPTQSRGLFEEIARVFPKDVWFGCAYHEGRAIACGCGFRWGDEFEMTWSSALREYSHLLPNLRLYWEFMERLANQGVRTFNFGRCTPGGGTHQFKQQWGGRDELLWWYADAAGSTIATPSPTDGAYAWGPRVWRRLPAPLATAVGPRIARCIP